MWDTVVSDEMAKAWTSEWVHNEPSLKAGLTRSDLRTLNKLLTKLFVADPQFLKLVTPQFIQQLTWKEINTRRNSDAPAT